MRDKNGAAVGQFLGLLPAPLPYLAVLKDGGLYYYVGSGEVLPLQSPKFKTNTCTLTAAYVDTSSPSASRSTWPWSAADPLRVPQDEPLVRSDIGVEDHRRDGGRGHHPAL